MAKLERIAPLVSQYMDPVEFLTALYRVAKAEFGTYSYIEFAEDLGFARTNIVHLMIRGKRPITIKSGEKIAEALNLRGIQRRYWLNLVSLHHTRSSAEREHLMIELMELKSRTVEDLPALQNQLEFFVEWYHSVIFEMAQLGDLTEDPKELAGALEPRIRPEQAKRSLSLLESMGLLIRQDGQLTVGEPQFSTPAEVHSHAIVRYHQKMIELGARSLTAIDERKRDVTSISFACDEAFIAELKTEIRSFRKKILALAEKIEPKDRVYQLNFQLFPTTRVKD